MTAQLADSDLAWLNGALFVEGGFGFDPRGEWSALPMSGTVQRIVPRHPRAAAGSFAKVHDAMSKTRRVVGRATQLALRVGLCRPIFRRGLTVDGRCDLTGDPELSLLASLHARVPQTRHVAITLGPERANRKPVVQLLDESGTSLAFAKVAVDELTTVLVTNEHRWLAEPMVTGQALDKPAVLDVFAWRDRPVLVIEAASVPKHQPEALDLTRIEALAGCIAGPGITRSLAACLDDWPAPTHDPEVQLERRARVAAQFGDRPLSVGPWHGDLSPWNTISAADATTVLDWEFGRNDVARMTDVVHHEVMVATHLREVDDASALDRAEDTARDRFQSTGSQPEAAFMAYLLLLAERAQPLGAAAARRLEQRLAP